MYVIIELNQIEIKPHEKHQHSINKVSFICIFAYNMLIQTELKTKKNKQKKVKCQTNLR